MLNLAVLTLTLTALPWSGESFVSTITSSSTGGSGSTLSGSSVTNHHHEPYVQRSRRRFHTMRQLQEIHPAQESHPSFSSPTVSFLVSYRRSSSLLSSALLTDTSSSRRSKRHRRWRRSNSAEKKGSGWHRRLLGKISFRRHSQGRPGGSGSSSSLPSTWIEHQEAQTDTWGSVVMREEEAKNMSDDFVARNFELRTPGEILPVVEVDEKKSSPRPKVPSPEAPPKVQDRSIHPIIDSEYFDVSIKPVTASSSQTIPVKSTTPTNTKKGLVCRLLKNVLMERIGQRWSTETPEGLEIDVRSSPDRYNNILRLFFRGMFRADATLSSNRIVFPTIRFSSIRLQMEQVTLSLLGFFGSNQAYYQTFHSSPNDSNSAGPEMQGMQRQNEQQDNQHRSRKRSDPATSSRARKNIGKVRYPEQFDLHIEDLTMSQDDLLFSSSIKNGLRRLLINVLKDRGIRSDSVRITSIDILPNGKIACIGEAKMHFPSWSTVHFEVRSGISLSNRGHVLNFPGLEVSLNRNIGLFVPVHPTLDLDVGHNAKFHNIVIDGRKKLIKLSASVTITPDRTRLTQDYVQSSEAFSAIFFYDVGQWLTRLGRFSK